MHSLTALIVEDEGPTRRKMMKLLEEFAAEIRLVGEASNGKEGLELAGRLKPDVVFLDIQMPGMDGFELLSKLDYQPRVVFTTAYQEFAVKAFEENAIDYLLKPVEPDRLRKCIERLMESSRVMSVEDIEQTLRKIQSQRSPEIISVKSGDRVIPLRLEEIYFFQSEDKWVRIFSSRGGHYLIDESLNSLGTTLPPNFLRIHRSHIVNTDHVLELKKYFNSRFMIYINDENSTVLTTGKSYYDRIKLFFKL